VRRAFQQALTLALGGTVVMIVIAAAMRSMGETRLRLLLTFVGVAVGAWLCEINARGLEKFRRLAIAGLASIAVSQVSYLLMAWTEWVVLSTLWRIWWISMVVSVASTHIVGLKLASEGRTGFWDRWTPWMAWAAAALWIGLALRRHIDVQPHPAYLTVLGVPAVGAVLGSLVIWRQWAKRQPPSEPMSARMRRSWQVAGMVGLFAGGFYIGRATMEPPNILDVMPSPLTGMKPEEIEAQVTADLARLKVLAAGVEGQNARLTELQQELSVRRAAENRQIFHPSEEDRLRAEFMTFLSYRAALLRMMTLYVGFEAAQDPALRARCFLVGFGAGTTTMASSLTLVRTFGDDPAARRKLNEAGPEAGLKAGMFDEIYANAAGDRAAELFEEMAHYFQSRRAGWRAEAVWPEPEFDWLAALIDRGIAAARARAIDRGRLESLAGRLIKRVKQDTYTPAYAIQSTVSTFIGDTRLVSRPSFISHEQIKQIQPRLRPGDILIERRNWFASNAFLPGFWPHAALYVGTPEELRGLGIAEEPAVKSRWARYTAPGPDGEPHTVLESVSEGVIFNSLTHSMGADYVGVMRPRLSDAERARAIVNAFRHEGRPYDFEFDFFTEDKLVCTELVYRSYQGMLHFDLVRIMGRDTLPALEIVKKFVRERGTPAQELDFVLFLDGDGATGRAREADEAAFCESVNRPQAFTE
jgi:hypothetical protein